MGDYILFKACFTGSASCNAFFLADLQRMQIDTVFLPQYSSEYSAYWLLPFRSKPVYFTESDRIRGI